MKKRAPLQVGSCKGVKKHKKKRHHKKKHAKHSHK